ncbi:MAG: hypothetical protein MZW92_09330 [Comamonadaceae bacterium]|nr:hypothetical protein [Comamonadaceae bacterium]
MAAPEQKLMLLGVIIAPGMKAALLRPEEPNAKTARIKLGETVGEWRLEAIFPNRVVVRKGQVTQELALVRPNKPAGPRAGRTGAKQGQDKVPPANVPVVPQPAELPQSASRADASRRRHKPMDNPFMRKILLPLASGALLALLLSACATTPSDESTVEMVATGGPPAGGSPRLTAKSAILPGTGWSCPGHSRRAAQNLDDPAGYG